MNNHLKFPINIELNCLNDIWMSTRKRTRKYSAICEITNSFRHCSWELILIFDLNYLRTVWIVFLCMKFPLFKMKVMKAFWDLFVAVHSLRLFLHRRELHSDCFCSFNQPFSFINVVGWKCETKEATNLLKLNSLKIGLPLDFHQFKFWLWIFDRASIFSSEKCRNFILRYSNGQKQI